MTGMVQERENRKGTVIGKIPELLSPAGSMEMLEAVIAQGADAVYMGWPKFGARAYAKNPAGEELLRAIDLAHLHGVRVHLTVNTLFKDAEMEELAEYVEPVYRQGVDAILVQDPGVLRFLHTCFPDLPLHISTQMSVTGPAGAAMLEAEGASRIVLARELSLPEIRKIREETSCGIETFVHGALCVCYSGRCLFSSMLGGRSGNRGRCAQPCRLPYVRMENGKEVSDPSRPYLLSPKDLCGLDLLPELVSAGVDSLKIEGRMKKPVYAAGVTAVYRKYLDMLAAEGRIRVDEEDRRTLHALFDRDGFTDGYLRGKTDRMIADGNRKLSAGGTAEAEMRELEKRFLIEMPKIRLSGNARLRIGEKAVFSAAGVSASSVLPVGMARTQPLTEEALRERLMKTGGTPFAFERINIDMEEGVFLPVGEINAMRRELTGKAASAILAAYLRPAPKKPLPVPSCGEFAQDPAPARDRGRTAQVTEVFVSAKEQLDRALEERGDVLGAEWDVLMEEGISSFVTRCRDAGKEAFALLPEIVRRPPEGYGPLLSVLRKMAVEGIAGFYARDTEGLALLCRAGLSEKTYADASLYTMNRLARRVVGQYAEGGDTVPFELNAHEIRARGTRGSALVVYGRIPLMVTAQPEGGRPQTLRDRTGADFPLSRMSDIWYNTGAVTRIGNSVPLYLCDTEDAAAAGRVRYMFTTEDAEEVSSVLRGGKPASFTRGHFRRGVE